ncbi:MAG: protelomerase family protein, partial [Sphaerospermopsis kisseleviana]
SNDPHELAVGLIAATGRRPHEILARARFAEIRGEAYHVLFSGQGKKRGEKPVFRIATLFPANYIIKKLNQLRELSKDFLQQIEIEFKDDIATQNRKIEDRRGNSLRRVVQEFFGGRGTETPVLNFRDGEDQNDCKALRAAYLCLATERDCKGSLGSKMLYAAKLAGHFSNENPTDNDLKQVIVTLGYADYFTTKPVPFPQIEIMKSNVRQINIRCSNASKIKVDQLCQEHKITQSQLIEKLIENFQQYPSTENTEVNKANNEIIKNQQLEIKNQQLIIQELQGRLAALQGRLADQKTLIEELEMKDTNNNQTTN